jgi:hypothetical protein
MAARLDEWTTNDDVVKSMVGGDDAAVVVSKLMVAAATEAAAIRFEIIKAAKRGKDISELCSRRIRALVRVAELRLTLAALEVGKLDVSSPMMQTVESLWMESVAEVAHQTVPEPESFLEGLRQAMAGWRTNFEAPRPGR